MIRKCIKTVEEVKEELKDFGTVFSFDTETTSLKYTELELEGVSLCNGQKCLYIPFFFRKGGNPFYWKNDDSRAIYDVLRAFYDNATLIIAHNIPFDLKVLHKYGIIPTCELFDTMVAEHLIDENCEKGLKKIIERVFGYTTKKYTEVNQDSGSNEFIEYALNDAEWVWKLAQRQKELLKRDNLLKLFKEIEMPFQYVLTEMAIEGIKVDIAKVEQTTKKLINKKEETVIEMLDYLNEPYTFQLDLLGNSTIQTKINFSSSQQLADILFNKLGLEVIEQTPTGQPSVGKLTLHHYKLNKFVKLLQKFKIIDKLLSGFFNPLPHFVEADKKVRPSFMDAGTRTGRLSCREPNLQQLPKVNKAFPIDTRACFIAPEGYTMLTADYSGQELRVLAQVSQEPVLLETFKKGKDMHLSTAKDFFNLEIPEEDLYETSPNLEKWKKRYKNERDKAKIINFGISYGKGAFGFSKDFDISEEEAQKILDKYFGALPGVKQAIDKCYSEVTKQGFVQTLFNRRRHFQAKEVNGYKFYPKSAYRQAFNFKIQGYSADMMRKAMLDVYKLSKNNEHWGLKTIGTVHDEAIYIVKNDYVEIAKTEIKRVLENAVEFDCPIKADIGEGDNYGTAK